MNVPASATPVDPTDTTWYRTSVFYEVLVRAFCDTTGSGNGDFTGLISKLDYLQWLGVDVLWVPPFYESPLRDGGYDIADYRAVLPEYGTLGDFEELTRQAHQRGMRVVIDLAINHTSDAHHWFQESRRNPEGPYGDYYVWSDTDTGYPDVRIIFLDTETSNWTFDPVRKQYFWHRFFSHQPDLNYDNPQVHQEVYDIVRFWLDRGVDGIRLDAIPYLYEREGTNCESLEPTHDFIAGLRTMVDAEYPGRMLLAESNQPPKETAAYFGTEAKPQCHMAFQFPVMPRIFQALRTGIAGPIIDVLEDLPEIPAGAQWATFLRNHDELTLEMVSDAERAHMWHWYAPEDRMKSNLGVRRRLAPLLENSRADLELAHILLFSMPGSPYLYYGDEIGMGDNIWLNDRDGVRTPMQWTPDRNAGFSTADPGKLYSPVVQSLVYHYQHVNVEVQQATPSSFLHWLRNTLAVRKAHPVFGLGGYASLQADNPHILAFLRTNATSQTIAHPGHATVLCVNNLATTAQGVRLQLPDHARAHLVDLFGGSGLPDIDDDGSVQLTLAPRGYLWLQVDPAV